MNALHRRSASHRSPFALRAVLPVAAIAGLLASIAPRLARADVARASLGVLPSPEAGDCGDAVTLAAAANRALRRDVIDPTGDEMAPLRFEVAFSRDDSGYVATVRESGTHDGERTIASGEPVCDALTQALGVTLAMMVDAAEAADRIAARRARPPAPPREVAAPPARDAEVIAPPLDRRTANDSVFLEGLGNGVYYSLNYERIFWDGKASLRAGFGYTRLQARKEIVLFQLYGNPPPPYTFTEIAVPVVASSYLGTASHKLQLGAGATVFYRTGMVGATSVDAAFNSQTSQGLDIAGTLVVAYRYIPYRGGPTFGAGFTPLFSRSGFLPWLSLSVGADF
jgi:hypothetical protein